MSMRGSKALAKEIERNYKPLRMIGSLDRFGNVAG